MKTGQFLSEIIYFLSSGKYLSEQMFLEIQPVILGTSSKILVPFMTPSLAFSTVTLNDLENIRGRQELRQVCNQQELK